MRDAIWYPLGVLDERGRFVMISAEAPGRLGVSPTTLFGRAFADLLHPDDRPRLAFALARGKRSHAASRAGSVELRQSEGRPALECRLNALDGFLSGPMTSIELRDREQVAAPPRSLRVESPSQGEPAPGEPQLKAAELETILRALPDLFFRFDAEGRFLHFSAPPSSDLYAAPPLFLGKRPAEVMPPSLAQAMEGARAETHRTGSLVTLEYELEVAGALRHFEARYVPFVEAQTIAMVRDVTDHRTAELALRASEVRLRESQKLEAVGRLAGGVAHDFNNLLMVILGYTSTAARHLDSDHPAAVALDEIRKAGQRANALTKQLLTLSRHRPSGRVALDLGEILREMHAMLERVIGESVVLRTSVQPNLSPILADRSQLEQLVLNLVLNARDAMPYGGELSIRADDASPGAPPQRAGAEGAASFVALTVADTGSGMAVETQARAFEPFFTTKPRGTGLGLFMVQQIARESGGLISVSSTVGVGTTITVRLPAADRAPEPVRLEAQGAMPRGDETLMVAEDEEAVRTLLVALLEELGYTVLSARNGAEALERAAAWPSSIDLLLSDVVMPGISGWELGARLASRYPKCRMLFMSGHPPPREHETDAATPHLAVLAKPFTPEALALRIRECLDQAG